MKRYWGAYGNKPDDTNLGPYDPSAPPAQQFRNPVHCVERSNDGLVYVCDRANDRLQVFQPGRHVREGGVLRQEHAAAPARSGTSRSPRTRSRASSILADGQNEKHPHHRARHARGDHRVRRRRTPAGPVLRRAQHRDRLQGQHLHDRDLRGQARCRSSSTRAIGSVPRGYQGVPWPKR